MAEYVFVDEWDARAPIEALFEVLADTRTYPEWWAPVYISVECDGPPAVGQVSDSVFKGRLPYRLKMRSEIVRYESPREFEIATSGDLTGRGVWTLTPAADGLVHVKFDWRVNADRMLLRMLTPVLRPLFRANHNYAIARAKAGLVPYATARAAPASGRPAGVP